MPILFRRYQKNNVNYCVLVYKMDFAFLLIKKNIARLRRFLQKKVHFCLTKTQSKNSPVQYSRRLHYFS